MKLFDGSSSSVPSRDERDLARSSLRKLSQHVNDSVQLRTTDSGDVIELPQTAVKLLAEILAKMAEGDAVTIIPIHAELTTQQAADLLGVSRPFLVKQLEAGKIPYRQVGRHRRVCFSDVTNYRQEMTLGRKEALNQLAEQAQELHMGY